MARLFGYDRAIHTASAIFVAALAAGASACYRPDPAEGLPCSTDRGCPDGQECGADNVCRPDGVIVPVVDAEPCAVTSCEIEILAEGFFTSDQITAAHPDYVFWTSVEGGQVLRTGKLDQQTVELDFGEPPYAPLALAADATTVYWTDSRTSGAIRSRPADQSNPAAALIDGQDFPLYVAIDDEFVYWTNDGGLVLRANRDGGGVSMVASSLGDGPAGGLAVDATHVYFADTGGGRIFSIPKDGSGQLSVVAANQLGPLGVAVNDRHAYWTSVDSGEVKRRSLDGGPVEIIASGQVGPSWIALGPNHVYWTNRTGNAVMSADTASFRVRVVASGQDDPNGVALDGDTLYWVNQTGPNRLLRTTPCGCR